MRKADIVVPVKAVGYAELTDAQRDLIDSARSAAKRAYAPYSHFSVGAAVLLDNGEILEGSNQENAAYPSGLCAERTAAFYAHSRFPDARFSAIAISAIGTDGQPLENPISPCGACRQSLLEYEKLAGAGVSVLLDGKDEIFILPSVSSLLPLAFTEF